ncbi:MAG: DNA polymerase III subunit beta [Sumerlaeia bacterium]
MLLTFDQGDVKRAATIVASLLNRSTTTLPVLANLLIETGEDECTFLGTDLDNLVRIRVPAKVEGGAGQRLTLPADKLAQLIGLMPAGQDVSIQDQGGQVRVFSGRNDYKLVTLPADDYPQRPEEKPLSTLKMAQRDFQSLLDAVLYAVPQKDHRRVLLGALFEARDKTLRLTGTDGKKLSRMELPAESIEGLESIRTVVSGKLLGDIRKVLSDEGSVTIAVGDRQVAIRAGDVEFRATAIEGKYPDCDQVIPKEFTTQMGLNRDLFKMAARRAGVVSDDKSKSIILNLEAGTCKFTSMAADIGTFSGDVAVEYDGESMEIAFNYQLMIETLDSFEKPEIAMHIKNEHSPCVFKAKDEDNHLCVLMPIKLAEARPAAAGAGAEAY